MHILKEIQQWVSIKNFTHEKVDDKSLERILEAGRRAPSAKNRQPWRFIVCRNENVRKKIKEASYGQEHVGQAPVIIAACTTNIEYTMPNGQLSYPVDISIASTFMLLQSKAEGLGACMVSTFDEEEIKEILSIPYSMRIVMLLLIGHPAETPMLNTRKSLSRIVGYDHW